MYTAVVVMLKQITLLIVISFLRDAITSTILSTASEAVNVFTVILLSLVDSDNSINLVKDAVLFTEILSILSVVLWLPNASPTAVLLVFNVLMFEVT